MPPVVPLGMTGGQRFCYLCDWSDGWYDQFYDQF
nr:MAG TPA: ubiquinol cytochrome c oxidoreductase [Caudoviricetes sp.]